MKTGNMAKSYCIKSHKAQFNLNSTKRNENSREKCYQKKTEYKDLLIKKGHRSEDENSNKFRQTFKNNFQRRKNREGMKA